MDEHKRQELMKQAGEKAAEYVEDGMVVGLGTGATTEYAIHKIGELVSEGLEIDFNAASKALGWLEDRRFVFNKTTDPDSDFDQDGPFRINSDKRSPFGA